MIEDAIEVATDPEYRFDLAIQLGRLEVAKVSSPLRGRQYYLAIQFSFLVLMSLICQYILGVMFILSFCRLLL